MSDLTAIDVLIDPDEATMERARYGPAVLLVQVSPEVLDFQARLAAAIAPFTESGGIAEAFVADPGEVISPTIIKWVEGYVPNAV